MKFLRTLLFSLVLFTATQVSAQVYRFKASSFSVMERDEKDKWGEWAPFEQSTVVITLDGKKDRIIVASHEIQLYKIETYFEKISNQYNDIVAFDCKDNDGGSCTIQIITRKNQGNRKQIYINYNDVKMVYNVYDSK